jgi:hypothetical protein
MPAQYAVGLGYRSRGRNVEGYRWLWLAIKNGSTGAYEELRSLEKEMPRSEIDEAKRLASSEYDDTSARHHRFVARKELSLLALPMNFVWMKERLPRHTGDVAKDIPPVQRSEVL